MGGLDHDNIILVLEELLDLLGVLVVHHDLLLDGCHVNVCSGHLRHEWKRLDLLLLLLLLMFMRLISKHGFKLLE